jgi:hypothetical protein
VSDQPDNLVLFHLRRIDAKLDRLTDDVGDLKRQASSIEQAVAGLHGDFSGQSLRLDRIDIRLDRIERRLDIADAET